MKQYLKLLEDIKEKCTFKNAAREGMPGTYSLFGYQFRHDLSTGFPLLTTKRMFWKGIVIELLWFLRGDTNIKYLIDNQCNFWNEDAYNYYLKLCDKQRISKPISFELFINYIKNSKDIEELENNSIKNSQGEYPIIPTNYIIGDCGMQYGALWRNLRSNAREMTSKTLKDVDSKYHNEYGIDQIANLIYSLKTNPESRRHIVSAWNVHTLDDMALNACHTMFQFNCRPISEETRLSLCTTTEMETITYSGASVDYIGIPKYYLDCQLYQRSADTVLGVPFNIASYALLTHIIAKICNMIPGDFIHTFGDAHIYENHMDAVNEQLTREPYELPKLELSDDIDWAVEIFDEDFNYNYLIEALKDYKCHPSIKAKLSTGLK